MQIPDKNYKKINKKLKKYIKNIILIYLMEEFKHCYKCNNDLPYTSFYKNKARKD